MSMNFSKINTELTAEVYELLLEEFSEERRRFDTLMKNQNEIKDALRLGASKARLVADETLRKVKNSLGYV